MKAPRFAHTSNSQRGMGGTMGDAIPAKWAKVKTATLKSKEVKNERKARITLA